MDKLLKEALDRLRSDLEKLTRGSEEKEKAHYTCYPTDGSLKTLASGTYTFDITEGKIYLDSTIFDNFSPMKEKANFARIEYTKDIKIAVNSELRGYIRAPLAVSPIPISYPDMDKIIIKLEESTDINFVASLSPIPTPTVGVGVGVKEQPITQYLAPTTTPLLGAGGIFISDALRGLEHGDLAVEIYSDVGAAALGVELQTSYDGTTWGTVFQDDYTGGEPKYSKVFSITNKYIRVKYTNGVAVQTAFEVILLRKLLG